MDTLTSTTRCGSDWPAGQSPCEIGRKPFGRITIANSDAAAAAYTDQAIDQGYRAITEIIQGI